MDIIIALAHIAGAVVVWFALGICMLMLTAWDTKRNQQRYLQDFSLHLGRTIELDEVESEENAPELIKFLSDRYSNEHLKNRISDFCGLLKAIWFWIAGIIQVGILGMVAWFSLTENIDNAIHIWWIIPVPIIFTIIGMIFSYICKLLTGRYPYEEKTGRSASEDWIKQRENIKEAKNSGLYDDDELSYND